MKPAFEQTPQRPWESFHFEELRSSSYNATWHFHPEYQITLVLKSHGYRLVGDNISPLTAGDLVFIGSNLPHVWHQDETGSRSRDAVHAIVVRFLDTFLGHPFLHIPEMAPVQRLLKRSRRGLHVTGRTRDEVADRLLRLRSARGLERIAGLLSILGILAESRELTPIASAGFVPVLERDDQNRVERVIAYINQHLAEPIDRDVLAANAHLSPSAFSRFFKLRTGKSLPRYLNELRVGRACRLLADEHAKIVDIALQCGFNNLANFNRRFREITGLNPSDYRRRLQESAS
ncbi:MAG TPA: AraC family transcriptional regulator [Verrucomicrobiota bacterium]|nr:AraC family transcriptional regulator [Verrucomicrobiota bacterium]HRT08916.1 AraC family transcriptional regulator [Candidatus Paceibacterota bacterium]HRT56892.1 AraC family transcriptional regulator [Candidatus Paceibacterota bacterium]